MLLAQDQVQLPLVVQHRPVRVRGRTDDGLPLHSLGSLLAELGTRCRNRCRLKSDPDGPVLELLTEPTALQRRALDLIKTFPVNVTP